MAKKSDKSDSTPPSPKLKLPKAIITNGPTSVSDEEKQKKNKLRVLEKLATRDDEPGSTVRAVAVGITPKESIHASRPTEIKSTKSNNKHDKAIVKIAQKTYDRIVEDNKELFKLFKKNLKLVETIHKSQKESLRRDSIYHNNNYTWFKNIVGLLKKENNTVEQQLKLIKSHQKDAIVEEEKRREAQNRSKDKDKDKNKDKDDKNTFGKRLKRSYRSFTRPIDRLLTPRGMLNAVGGGIMSLIFTSIPAIIGLVAKLPAAYKFIANKLDKLINSIKSSETLSVLKTMSLKMIDLVNNTTFLRRRREIPQTTSSDQLSDVLSGISDKLKDKPKSMFSMFLSGLEFLQSSIAKGWGLISPMIKSITGLFDGLGKSTLPGIVGSLSLFDGGIARLVLAITPALGPIAVVGGIIVGLATIAWQVNEAYNRISEIFSLFDSNQKELDRQKKKLQEALVEFDKIEDSTQRLKAKSGARLQYAQTRLNEVNNEIDLTDPTKNPYAKDDKRFKELLKERQSLQREIQTLIELGKGAKSDPEQQKLLEMMESIDSNLEIKSKSNESIFIPIPANSRKKPENTIPILIDTMQEQFHKASPTLVNAPSSLTQVNNTQSSVMAAHAHRYTDIQLHRMNRFNPRE